MAQYLLAVAILVLTGSIAWGQGTARTPGSLPEPLTLGFALSEASASHPELDEAQARIHVARARIEQERSKNRLQSFMSERLRWAEPADNVFRQRSDDHAVGLFFRQRLYDFGRSGAEMEAAEARLSGSEWDYIVTEQQRRIAVAQRFFDVIVADLQFARDNEAMATAFIKFDRARERNELGQVSDVDLLRLEASYHAARSTRYASQLQQRATRSGLANALNRPGQLPTDLVTPELPYSSRERGEVEGLTRGALAANARLKALRARVESARKTMRAVRAQRYPVVSSEVDVARYSPHFGTSREPARGGITLEVPLSTGGRIDAVLAEHRAELQGITARLAGRELEVRQLVLGLWLELEGLQVRGDELAVLRDSRELNLDRNRALYELEVAADLGDAMVEISDLRLREAELEFRTAIVWAQLDALRGQRVLREVRDR